MLLGISVIVCPSVTFSLYILCAGLSVFPFTDSAIFAETEGFGLIDMVDL